MKSLTFHALAGWSIGTMISWYTSGWSKFDAGAWAIIAAGLAYIYAIWRYDNRDEA